jgi:S1-C subfamily serine protease
MRFVFLLVLAMIMAACCSTHPPPAPKAPAADIVVHTRSRSVALFNPKKPQKPYCAAVWVAEDKILTAAHCVDDEGPEIHYATKRDDIDRIAGVIRADEYHDLALLWTPQAPPGHAIARVGRTPHVGDLVHTVGSPHNEWFVYSRGLIANDDYQDAGVWMRWLQTSVPIAGGSSGGGCFDEYGELVGITARRSADFSYFVHHQYVVEFLK